MLACGLYVSYMSGELSMVWIHVLFAVLAAIAFTAILLAIGRGNAYESGGWGAALILFAVLFLTSWAGGIWLHPLGPELFGAPWMPFVLTAFVVTMLVAAMSPVRRSRGQVEARQAAVAEEVVGTTVSAFLWIFAICLIAAITLHYAYHDERNAGPVAGRQAEEALR